MKRAISLITFLEQGNATATSPTHEKTKIQTKTIWIIHKLTAPTLSARRHTAELSRKVRKMQIFALVNKFSQIFSFLIMLIHRGFS